MKISQLVLGTAQLGLSYGIANKQGKLDRKKALDLLSEAARLGITNFDTASSYGDAEALLGNYFRENPSSTADIITKIRPLRFNEKVDTYVADKILKTEIEGALSRLEISKISLMMFHNFEDLLWKNNYLITQLSSEKYRTKVSSVGVSVYSPIEALQAIKMENISAIQIPTNLLDMRFIKNDIFSLATLNKKKIFIRSIYLQGLLLMSYQEVPVHLKQIIPYRLAIEKIADELAMTVPQLSFAFLNYLGIPFNLVIGCENLNQLRENVDLCLNSDTLSEESAKKVRKAVKNIPEWLLDPREWESKKIK
jgi:aryl-alcohol dehydrogenase-like predicted oxidoreductase